MGFPSLSACELYSCSTKSLLHRRGEWLFACSKLERHHRVLRGLVVESSSHGCLRQLNWSSIFAPATFCCCELWSKLRWASFPSSVLKKKKNKTSKLYLLTVEFCWGLNEYSGIKKVSQMLFLSLNSFVSPVQCKKHVYRLGPDEPWEKTGYLMRELRRLSEDGGWHLSVALQNVWHFSNKHGL